MKNQLLVEDINMSWVQNNEGLRVFKNGFIFSLKRVQFLCITLVNFLFL